MNSYRQLTGKELNLINYLIKKSNRTFSADWAHQMLVQQVDDGGMGSLYLIPDGISDQERKFGAQISDMQFIDSDGVEVLASLYVDQHGKLFELDVWKTNFGKLIDLPIIF